MIELLLDDKTCLVKLFNSLSSFVSTRENLRAKITEIDAVVKSFQEPLHFHLQEISSTNNNMSALQNGAPPRAIDDDSDVEEEALAADYREQVQYEGEELEQVTSLTMAQQTDDIQSRLAAAAQPLDFSAPLEVKFASYDNYCSLFHFILNSEGPVDLEPPSVRYHELY